MGKKKTTYKEKNMKVDKEKEFSHTSQKMRISEVLLNQKTIKQFNDITKE